MAKVETSIIRARSGDAVTSVKICWPQEKADRLSALYPDGISDVENFSEDTESTPAEQAWLRAQVRFQLGLSTERPAPITTLPWIKAK